LKIVDCQDIIDYDCCEDINELEAVPLSRRKDGDSRYEEDSDDEY
jgi:hypothetical protein